MAIIEFSIAYTCGNPPAGFQADGFFEEVLEFSVYLPLIIVFGLYLITLFIADYQVMAYQFVMITVFLAALSVAAQNWNWQRAISTACLVKPSLINFFDNGFNTYAYPDANLLTAYPFWIVFAAMQYRSSYHRDSSLKWYWRLPTRHILAIIGTLTLWSVAQLYLDRMDLGQWFANMGTVLVLAWVLDTLTVLLFDAVPALRRHYIESYIAVHTDEHRQLISKLTPNDVYDDIDYSKDVHDVDEIPDFLGNPPEPEEEHDDVPYDER